MRGGGAIASKQASPATNKTKLKFTTEATENTEKCD